MGHSGASLGWALSRSAVAVLVVVGSLALFAPSSQSLPGDLTAPVYSDGDWWNYSVAAPHTVLSKAGDYTVQFSQARGWLRFEVGGTTSHQDHVAWEMEVRGKLRLSGSWSGAGESGDTVLEANVSGTEVRATRDLALLGYSISYSGAVEIATHTEPYYFNLTIWENVTLTAPLRMMLFPVPVAQFPQEHHRVTVTRVYQTGSYAKSRVEVWNYTSTYKGLKNAQGDYLTFVDQNHFEVAGGVQVGGEADSFNSSLYYDPVTRKAPSIDELRGFEVVNYHIDTSQREPDLVVGEGEFNVTDYAPPLNKEVSFSARVHNLGEVEVLKVDVELWSVHGEGLPQRENKTTIGQINAQASFQVHFNWTPLRLGDWQFILRVDPDNVVTEEREDNNEVKLTLEAFPDRPRPNLFIPEKGIILNPDSPLQNRTAVRITVIVSNEGPGDAENVTVDWFLGRPGSGGVPIGWRETVDYLPAGESREAWITWYANKPGHQVIWAYLDRNNTVNETVETDNIGSVPMIIIASPHGGVDLVVVNIHWLDSFGLESEQLPKGERSTVRVIISNEGPNNATLVHLSLYVDTEDRDGMIGSKEGRIDVGNPATWDLTWVVGEEKGPHQLIATVLAIGEVESTFTDNRKTLSISVGPRSTPEPSPMDITVFPDKNILQPGERIAVSGKVTFRETGIEVPGATVELSFASTTQKVTVSTNENGRYVAEIRSPVTPGAYHLSVMAEKGPSVGSAFVKTVVEKVDGGNGGNGGSNGEEPNWLLFVVILVIVLAVGMPLTYYLLLSKAAMERRIRKVHEEIVEIVDEER